MAAALALMLFEVAAGPGQTARPPGSLALSGPLTYSIADGSGVPGYDSTDPRLARMALEAWSRESGGRIQFVEAPSADQARVRIVWVAAESGLFGQARPIEVGGQPGAVVFVTPGVDALGADLARGVARDRLLRHVVVYLACVHELGHALGLAHTDDFADIMYSFAFGGDILDYFMRYRLGVDEIGDIPSRSGLSDGDRAALGALYPSEGPAER
jgi:hypothetical protein